jgi:hypothetical protein
MKVDAETEVTVRSPRRARLDAPFGAAVILWPNRILEAPEGALDSGARIQT